MQNVVHKTVFWSNAKKKHHASTARKTEAIGLKYEFLFSFLHIQEPTAITCTTRGDFFSQFHGNLVCPYISAFDCV